MDNCSRHSKQVAGIVDMKLLAEAIGDLHYQALAEFLGKLSDKLIMDAGKDREGNRYELAHYLEAASNNIRFAHYQIEGAYNVCKPFMNKKENNG